MFSTPQKRDGAATIFNSPSTRMPLTKGLFSDGIWHCNCSPRLPASNFEVKKQGKNNGRWFYTCQTAKEDGGCGFFLWGEDAKIREGKTVLANSRSESEPLNTTIKKAATVRRYDLEREDWNRTPSKPKIKTELMPSSEGSSEDFGEWPLSPSAEKKVVERYDTMPPETPRKVARIDLSTTTPSSKRKRDFEDNGTERDGLPTPITGHGAGRNRISNESEYHPNDSDPFSTPSSLRTPSSTSKNNSFGIRSPSHTPTPQNSSHTLQDLNLHNTSSNPFPPNLTNHTPLNDYDLGPSILSLLHSEKITLPSSTQAELQLLLEKHAMRVSGIAKGRDITRVALKSKDVKIAELTLRLNQLEAEREIDRRVLRGLRAEKDERENG